MNLTTNSGGSVSLNALKAGDEVEVRLTPANQADRVRATFKMVVGRLDTLASQGRAIVLINGQVYRVVEEDVEVIINDRPSTIANLRPGMVVTLRLNPVSNFVWGITAETVAAQEPTTRPGRPVIATPEAGASIAGPVEIRGSAEGATKIVVTIDALLGVRLASPEANVGPRGRYRLNLNYQQPFPGGRWSSQWWR